MRPMLAAEELKRNLTQYLTTTFALADRPAREGLERFLNDPRQGMFRGPYLRIRTPFMHAGANWRQVLDWAPDHPVPYLHQVQAWHRLNSKDRAPEPTLITTGTGSGKTEAFLIPILDHCRRERVAEKAGVKAVLLYPMNALATDQADRINRLLTTNDLPGVEFLSAVLNPTNTLYQDLAVAIPVPEPSTLAIATLGALGLMGYGWCRRARSRRVGRGSPDLSTAGSRGRKPHDPRPPGP